MRLKPALFILIALLMSSGVASAAEEIRVLLVPELESTLSSRISSQITAIKISEGERFIKDQPLLEFDCAILKAQLQKARMDLEAARETHETNQQLRHYGSVSQLEVAVSSARMKRAQADVLLNQAIVEHCLVIAPYDGRLVKLKVNPHESVSPNDPLMEIIDDRHLKIRLLLPSHWLRWLKEGLEFTVRLDETGKRYQARLSGIGAKVNPVNQTVEGYGVFVSPHELLAGMSGTAYFTVPK